jgi:hypothetical protein
VTQRLGPAITFMLFTGSLACGRPRPPALSAELTEALKDTSAGFFEGYRSDGTAVGDSARRIAAFAMWEIEGGDVLLGLRLLDSAAARGVPDPHFYEDAEEVFKVHRDSTRQARVRTIATRRWPDRRWRWQQTEPRKPEL